MATTTEFTEPIPDRRRTRFARNGGRRPTAADRRRAIRGITAAREVLESTDPGAATRAVVEPMAAERIAVARDGIAAARKVLSA